MEQVTSVDFDDIDTLTRLAAGLLSYNRDRKEW